MNDTPPLNKFCFACGEKIDPRAEICPKCGVRQQGIKVQGEKSRVAAILLAFFLGGFGAHKFYLGRVGWGLVYLLFFWTVIPSIVAFVEFIIYICSPTNSLQPNTVNRNLITADLICMN